MAEVGVSQTGRRLLSMGRVTDLPQVLDELLSGHRELNIKWNDLIRISKTVANTENSSEDCSREILKLLQQKAAEFLKCAEAHIELEVQFVPEREAYFCPEDTVPSIHFASLVMNELYKAAKTHVIDFIRQVNTVREPISVKRARSIIGHLREDCKWLRSIWKQNIG